MGNLDILETDPTLERVNEVLAATASSWPVRSMGVSWIGTECSRQMWYKFNNFPSPPIDAKGLRTINSGYASEDKMEADLRAVPELEMWTIDPTTKKQYGFKIGIVKGYLDGIIRGLLQAPKTPHVWEHKERAQKFFNSLHKAKNDFGEKAALKNWEPLYYDQAVVNMYGMNIKRHYLTVSTGGFRDIITCRTDENKPRAKYLIDRAQGISEMKEAPDREYPKKAHFKCKFCDYREECWKDV